MDKTPQDYLNSKEVKRLAKNTQEMYGYALAHMEEFLKQNLKLSPAEMSRMNPPLKLDNFKMKNFAAYLEEKGTLSGQSVQQYLTCTKIFLNWAGHHVEYVYRRSNQDIQENKRKHLDRWFSEMEIEMCLQYNDFTTGRYKIGPMYRAIVHILIETGCRVGEISNIKLEDMHLDDQYIIVHGKTEPRPVIISEETVDMLRTILSKKLPYHGADSFFPEVSKIKKAVNRMLFDLGLKVASDGRGPHTFRHYAATYLYYTGGMDIESLAFLLGDKVDTIRAKYLHPTPDMIRKKVLMAWGKWEEVAP
jgi:integrase/recombinase XerD